MAPAGGRSASAPFRVARSRVPDDLALGDRGTNLFDSIIREKRVVQIQLPKLTQFGQPFCSGIGDVGAVEAESFERGQSAQRLEPLVSQVGIVEVQVFEMRQA